MRASGRAAKNNNGAVVISADVALLLETMQATIARHEERIAALERAFGPRDDSYRLLLVEIARATHGAMFTARSLWAHGQVDEGLGRALENADVDGPRSLGALLPRFTLAIDGMRLEPQRESRDGRRYRVVFCDSWRLLKAQP